jgi:hypothetical protein
MRQSRTNFRQEISAYSENFTNSRIRRPERKRRDPGVLSVDLTSQLGSETDDEKGKLVGVTLVLALLPLLCSLSWA